MESIEKYKAHLIKNLANKESKYMPSITSISDLSITGINNKWSNRWNNEVQFGAEIPHENGESENKSEQDEIINEESNESNKSNNGSSVIDDLNQKSLEGSHKEFTKREFDEYRARLKEQYKDNYQKKYDKFKYIFENREEANYPLGSERVSKEALNGLGFWSTYRKVLETAYNKDNIKEDQEQQQADNQFQNQGSNIKNTAKDLNYSDDLNIRGNCSSCKRPCNNTGEGRCISCSNNNCKSFGNNKPVHILVTRSKSGKLIDRLTIDYNNKGIDKPVVNKINITVKSKLPRKMVTFNNRNTFVDDGLSPLKIEPTFGNNQNNPECYSKIKHKCFVQSQDGFDKPVNGVGSKGYKVPIFGTYENIFDEEKQDLEGDCKFGKDCRFTKNANYNVCPVGCDYSGNSIVNDQNSSSDNQCSSSVYTPFSESDGNVGVRGYSNNHSNYNCSSNCNCNDYSNYDNHLQHDNTYDSMRSGLKHCGHSYTNNTNTNSNDVNCSFDGDMSISSMGSNFNDQNILSPDLSSFEGYEIPETRTVNNYSDGYSDVWTNDIVDLLVGNVKLHAFKINNKSVNVPLFLNIGNNQSVYSGQGFVSNTNIGLFKISVVDPVEPKVSLGSKIVNLIGMNNYNHPACKCTNLDITKSIKNAVPVATEVVNGIWNSISDNKGVQWMNNVNKNKQGGNNTNNGNRDNRVDKINRTSGPTIASKGSNDLPIKPVVCDFHKNLFSHKVDRTRFGKDVFCQLKYMNSISSDTPIKITKNNFTAGSNVSSFFNGFYEQLLCLGDTTLMNKNDIKNNHKFTFIIRRVKGSKYGKNFVIINTTSGQHLCIDLLTHELKFEEECKFSKYLVPAIFKIIALPTLVESISKDILNCFKPIVGNYCGYQDRYYYSDTNNTQLQSIMRTPTHMSTTDQYINVS